MHSHGSVRGVTISDGVLRISSYKPRSAAALNRRRPHLPPPGAAATKMYMVKTSVEGSKCLLRHVLPGEVGVRCARDRGSPRRGTAGDGKGHDVAAGQPVVEVWLKIEDLLPFSASVEWRKCATVCKACYDAGGRGIGLLDIWDTH